MYIVAIAWLYIAFTMSLTAKTVVGGVLAFVGFGLAPLALFLYLAGTRARRRRLSARVSDDRARGDDRADTERDQKNL